MTVCAQATRESVRKARSPAWTQRRGFMDLLSVPNRSRDFRGGFPDQSRPSSLHALGRGRHRQAGDQSSRVVANARTDAAHAELRLLVVQCVAVAADALELALEGAGRGERVARKLRQMRPLGVAAKAL